MGRIRIWIFILTLASCVEDVNPGQHYVFYIQKGKHVTVHTIKKTSRSRITFAFRFDESARYQFDDLDQYDTNKLFGIKHNHSPHKNSARFGWRWHPDGYIVIAAYSYVDGVRDIHDIGHCFPNDINSAEIEETENEFIYRFQGTEYTVPKSATTKKRLYSFPYFGGNKPAPQQIKIELWF